MKLAKQFDLGRMLTLVVAVLLVASAHAATKAETQKVTRYGARIYRKHRVDTAPPVLKLPEPWRLVDGDEGVTGCDRRLYYFTIEADGEAVPSPTVTVSWPGVDISSVAGASNVKMTTDGVILKPTGKSGGVSYVTSVRDGVIELGIHHHVEGAQHGRYAGRPLPWEKIHASDNWRAACLAMFKEAGFTTGEDTDGASIRLFGFDSNYPNHHVDHPEHFHVMLAWGGWENNNVGHYILYKDGFMTKNVFHIIGDVAGKLSKGCHVHNLGETTDYVGPKGRICFSLEMFRDGKSLVLHKPDTNAIWRVCSECPDQSVAMEVRNGRDGAWLRQGSYSVHDDTDKGDYAIFCEENGIVRKSVIFYNRDTGARLVAREAKLGRTNGMKGK